MGQTQALANAFSVIVVVTFWACVAFPVVVGTFWKWWQTGFGQSYMSKVILLALALSGPAIHRMFGIPINSVFYGWWIVVTFGAITPALGWRLGVLWAEQRRGRSLNPFVAVRDWARQRRAAET